MIANHRIFATCTADELDAAYVRLLYAVYVYAEREAQRAASPADRRRARRWLNYPEIRPLAEFFRQERAKRGIAGFQTLHVEHNREPAL